MPVDLFVTAALSRAIASSLGTAAWARTKPERRATTPSPVASSISRAARGSTRPPRGTPRSRRSAKPRRRVCPWSGCTGTGLSNTANNIFYNSADHAVYYTAAVGIVFDRHIHKQYFFHGHDNDIKVAMHPKMHLWPPDSGFHHWSSHRVHLGHHRGPKKGRIRGLVAQLPFEGAPAVIGLAFSEDGERLTVITNDMDHTVYVFDWEKADRTLGELAGTLKGAPTELEEGVFPGLITVGKGGRGTSSRTCTARAGTRTGPTISTMSSRTSGPSSSPTARSISSCGGCTTVTRTTPSALRKGRQGGCP